MKIENTTKQILKVLQVIAWIIFIGLCIEAGGLISTAVYTLAFNADGAKSDWNGVDLVDLYKSSQSQYITVKALMIIIAVLKVILFYLIIKVFTNKQLNIEKPFTIVSQKFIASTSYICFGIALFANWGTKVRNTLDTNDVAMPNLTKLNFAGADVWFFMGVVLLVIAQIFKRGIEIQEENDLTV